MTRAATLENRFSADYADLLELHQVDPVAAERIRSALVDALIAMHRPASLTELATSPL